MFLDEKKIGEAQTDLSLESFIAWAETQPLEREYYYCNPDNCLIAQWLKATGIEKYNLRVREVAILFNGCGLKVARKWPHTVGAALRRARALLRKNQRAT